MKVFNENYALITEDFFDGGKEVFDFHYKDFIPLVDEEYFNTSLANIDILTTSFLGPYDIYSYLNNDIHCSKEDFAKTVYVQYISRKTGKINKLPVVWNDKMLHAVATNLIGNSVDFANPTTKEIFYGMYSELIDSNSSFRDYVLDYVRSMPSINSYNCNLIREINNTHFDNREIFKKIPESFSSYREFRSLYVIYKKYLKYREKKEKVSFEKK